MVAFVAAALDPPRKARLWALRGGAIANATRASLARTNRTARALPSGAPVRKRPQNASRPKGPSAGMQRKKRRSTSVASSNTAARRPKAEPVEVVAPKAAEVLQVVDNSTANYTAAAAVPAVPVVNATVPLSPEPAAVPISPEPAAVLISPEPASVPLSPEPTTVPLIPELMTAEDAAGRATAAAVAAAVSSRGLLTAFQPTAGGPHDDGPQPDPSLPEPVRPRAPCNTACVRSSGRLFQIASRRLTLATVTRASPSASAAVRLARTLLAQTCPAQTIGATIGASAVSCYHLVKLAVAIRFSTAKPAHAAPQCSIR